MKRKGKWRVASDEWRDKAQKIPHPGGLYGCETKRVAGKGICNDMKTKGEEKWLAGSEWWVAREENTALSDTHRIAGKKRDETGTRSAEPWCRGYRIRYYLSSEKIKSVN
jgi:hypothetical protein